MYAHFVKNFFDGGKLPFPSVDDDKLRTRKPFFFLRPQLGKPSSEHLLQRSKVVRSVHRLNAETAIRIFIRLSVLKDDHASHFIHARNVRNVVTLHALGIPL